MKKRFFGAGICALLLSLLIFPVALADTVSTVYGNVTASHFPTGDVVLKGDTTLTLDRDVTVRSIRGNYALTVVDQGSHTLTVSTPLSDQVITANASGHGIAVKSLSSNATLYVTARKDGLSIDGDIYVSGDLNVTSKGGSAVYSKNGNIRLMGTTILEADRSCVYAAKGSVTYDGAYLNAETTGDSSYCIEGQGVDLNGDTITVISKSNCIVSYGTLKLGGTVTAKSTKANSVAVNACNGGDILIASDAAVTAYGGCGYYAQGSFTVETDETNSCTTVVNAYAGARGGIVADQNITLFGTVDVIAQGSAVFATKGELNHQRGTLTAKTTGKRELRAFQQQKHESPGR